MSLTPEITWTVLMLVQAAHLLHHRLAKRHISHAEVVSALVLCIPPTVVWLSPALLMAVHLMLIGIQVIGSLWIRRLSPVWDQPA